MNRLFVLREPIHFQSMLAALSANWPAMAASGQPLGVTVAPYKRTRSQEQNALMWIWLDAVTKQAWLNGQQYSDQTWHEHCKREFLPERNAKGDEKWQILPNGNRTCIMSTTRLNAAEMSEYMTKLDAFFVSELGVTLP